MIELIICLVIDTFIICSLNGQNITNNIKDYAGIETIFAVIGVFVGSFILSYVCESLFYMIAGVLIIIIQLLDVLNIPIPSKVTPMLLGADSMLVFAGMSYTAIPLLTIMELLAIIIASIIGNKFVKYIPFNEYLANVAMVIIAIEMLL